jgi:hypothetical protein
VGSDAEVFLFDYEAYTTIVVPAFLTLLRSGHLIDWMRPFFHKRRLQPELWDRTDVSRFLAGVKEDFSCAGPYDLEETFGENWRQRWARSAQASPPSEATAEQVNWLFKIAVEVKCLGRGQFVGRSATVSNYANILSELHVKQSDRVIHLLAALGKRGYLIGFQFGFGFEGINGWLDPPETLELAEKLDPLPLPRYGVSFAAMEQFRIPESGSYKCEGSPFEALSLSFVRTVATIASGEGQGLLWGNGIAKQTRLKN